MFKIFTHIHILYALQAMKIKQTDKEMGKALRIVPGLQ